MTDQFDAQGGPIQVFYAPKGATRLPIISHADGIYMWDTDGKRYIDASSGPVCSNLGHGNARVVAAMTEQASKVAFASRAFFENEPNIALSNLLAELAGPGFERAFLVSGGSEAVESALKMARQYAVAKGQAGKWKVLSRMPGYHGGTLGAVGVTGDPQSEALFGGIARVMPKVPAPITYRVPEGFDADSYVDHCADALEQAILEEKAETVLAFIMEPVGGLATGALVAPDRYYNRIREICTRHGVILIYDEVMSGAGRTGTFLSAAHWPDAQPDIVTLAKGISSGYTPFGVVLASREMVDVLRDNGGFLHGHTYSANPLSCAVGHAVLTELVERKLMDNAARMGAVLRGKLETLKARSPHVGDVRGKGLLLAIEIVPDKSDKSCFAPDDMAINRVIDLARERGLMLYTRRTAEGRYGDWVMIAPPLIITEAQVDEMMGLLDATMRAFAEERAVAN